MASERWEREQINRLNYRTFVEEIPQHESNPGRVLVDRFDDENTYIVCLRGQRLAGVIAIRAKRPFSLDDKLPDLDRYLPPAVAPCEIRLLAVEPGHRGGAVFRGLLEALADHCAREGHDLALISGAIRQLPLYRHIGFQAFGPRVGTADAPYQPMFLTRDAFARAAHGSRAISLPGEWAAEAGRPVSFLPGPTAAAPDVRQAMGAEARSHRSRDFTDQLKRVKRLLCDLTRARHVEICVGSGTLANDLIAGQLSLLNAPGLVLSNGEFGERLVDHARRFGLRFETLAAGWGEPFDAEQIEAALTSRPAVRWLWATHCETSTGVLNDLPALRAICRRGDVRLCLDCISSIGAVPVDLDGVFLASGVSGKALGAFAGLSLVFYHHTLAPSDSLPRYLDLGLYAATGGVPFTHSSNLLDALEAATRRLADHPPFTRIARQCHRLHEQLRRRDLVPVAREAITSPAVITLQLPTPESSAEWGEDLERQGIRLGWASEYLVRRNWIQICLMGAVDDADLTRLLSAIDRRLVEAQLRGSSVGIAKPPRTAPRPAVVAQGE